MTNRTKIDRIADYTQTMYIDCRRRSKDARLSPLQQAVNTVLACAYIDILAKIKNEDADTLKLAIDLQQDYTSGATTEQ